MEQSQSNWQWVHSYQGLARAGYVKNLTCPEDTATLVPVFDMDAVERGDDDDLALWCPSCDGLIIPGVDMMSQIRAVVNEHREDLF